MDIKTKSNYKNGVKKLDSQYHFLDEIFDEFLDG